MAGSAEEAYEAHLPAVQARPQASPRVPRAHGDDRRSPRSRRAPRQGPQAPVGLTFARLVLHEEPQRLTARPQFLAARRGRRLNGPFFFIEALDRGDGAAPRYGLTVTRKVGNAVVRNRIRRRLREAVRTGAGADMAAGFDYVIVARGDIIGAPFEAIGRELSRRFRKTAPPAATGASARSSSASEL